MAQNLQLITPPTLLSDLTFIPAGTDWIVVLINPIIIMGTFKQGTS